MGGKYSIKETKEVLDLALALGGAVKSALDDKKIDVDDLIYLIGIVPKIEPAITDISKIPKELGELDEAEGKELMQHVSAKLGGIIEDQELRKKVEKGLALGLALAEFIAALRSKD